jgi:predicted transcriptional regulator
MIRLFSDSIVRAILGALKNKLLTTKQITAFCKSSETTTYRKIKLLIDYGIIREKGFLLSKGGGRAHFYYSILEGMRLIFDKETSLFIKINLPEC